MYIENLFLWDGDQLLLDLDSLGNRIGEYVYHPGTIDSPLGVITGSTSPVDIRYYQEDRQGNVIGYSADSSVTMKVSYDSWGVRNVELDDYNRLNWKGLWWEGDGVSLYYMRNRWYDPETGRFMSEDPIGHAGGINLYAFANNDPINGIDPSGLAYECEWVSVMRYGRRERPEYAPTAVVTSIRVCTDTGVEELPPSGGAGGRANGGDIGDGPRGVNSKGTNNRPIMTRQCFADATMLAITAISDFTVVGPAARAGVRLGSRAIAHGVGGIGADALRGMGYLNKSQYGRLAARTWGAAAGYSVVMRGYADRVALEAAGTMDLGLASANLSGWDFVPYVATGRSLVNAWKSCM